MFRYVERCGAGFARAHSRSGHERGRRYFAVRLLTAFALQFLHLAFRFHLLVADHATDNPFNLAFELLAHSFDRLLRLRYVLANLPFDFRRMAFRFHLLVADQIADAFLYGPFDLFDLALRALCSITHDRVLFADAHRLLWVWHRCFRRGVPDQPAEPD
jgi:hypothetical protein